MLVIIMECYRHNVNYVLWWSAMPTQRKLHVVDNYGVLPTQRKLHVDDNYGLLPTQRKLHVDDNYRVFTDTT